MDTERPHRATSSSSSTSELFVCFTSRLSSSSSMKLSSKSILSPSRSREPPQISLSTSLSRRLRNNGSMKGGQASPMFPNVGGKRRGCGFENPEPSSPKVTCIGQVRVKTKKQGKKMRSISKRRGEASFRRTEQQHGFQVVGGANSDLTRQNSQGFQYQNHQNLQQECLKHRNQRWVHLPLTICEALREFSCFFPCRSSCMSKEEKSCAKGEGSSGAHDKEGSCGAAFARWVVAMQEGDVKGREIELVMGEEHDGNGRGNNTERSSSQRRHVFEDIDIDVVEGKNKKDEEFGGEEEEKARVSICIPPKNALLLMRCRSDPVKMAALANRFWESPVHKDNDEENEEDDDEDNEDEEEGEEAEEGGEEEQMEMEEGEEEEGKGRSSICEREREAGFVNSEEDYVILQLEAAEEAEPEVKKSCEIESRLTNPERSEVHEPNQDKEEEEEEKDKGEEENGHQSGAFASVCSTFEEAQADLEKPETEEVHPSLKNLQEEHEDEESSELSSSPSTFIASEPQNEAEEAKSEAEAESAMAETSAEGSTDEERAEEKGTPETPPEKQGEEETDPAHEGSDPVEDPELENGSKTDGGDTERETLPECLLLMMCEPKLSMEVSKETWVCSTDFVRWPPPERPAGKADAASGGDGRRVGSRPKKPSPQPLMQPPRSSCSFPAAPAVGLAGMIEQKLVGSKSNNGYEPFVLTRCKSEPMRSSAKLTPEACFWKNRKLEPAARVGVGAPAGVGF